MKNIVSIIVFSTITHFAIAQNTILWSIKKPNSENVSHFLGTYHFMGNSFVDQKPLIKELLTKAEVAVFEVVEDKNIITNEMLKRADDFSYREHLYAEDIVRLEVKATTWKVPLYKLKPSELLVKLRQEYIIDNCRTILPSDTAKHMDDYLQVVATQKNIKLVGLETYSDQIHAINSNNGDDFTWSKSKDPVHQALQYFQDSKNQEKICALASDYAKMKLNYQLKVKCVENDKLLIDRNNKWMPQIQEIIQQHTSAFIAVGLLHLFGDCGLISQLRKAGYEVNPVKLK